MHQLLQKKSLESRQIQKMRKKNKRKLQRDEN